MNFGSIHFFILFSAICFTAVTFFYFYRMQKKLNLLAAELKKEKKMASLGDLCGGIAHEINNPLAVISARAQILQSHFQADKFDKVQIAKSIDTISLMADRIVKILKSVKLFAKIPSSNPSTDPFETTSLNEIIVETISLIEMRSTKFSVQVRKVGFESDIIIECQPSQVFQALWNALASSFDSLAAQTEKWIQLELLDEGANMRLKITNSSLNSALVLLLPKNQRLTKS